MHNVVDSLLQHMSPTGLCRDVGNSYLFLSQAAVQKDIDAAKEVIKNWGDTRIRTYREYFQKYGDEAADALIQASNQEKIGEFDQMIADVNARLHEVVSNRNFDQLKRWCTQLDVIVEG